MYLSFAPKIAFSNFFSLRKKFLSVCGPRILMICSWNLSSALQKTVHFIRKKHFSCTWALLLKLHLATFSHWEEVFEHLWPRILISCLVALNTVLVLLEAIKKWFCAFKLQNYFFCKKAQTHENLSSALQKNVHFIRKKTFSCTWALLLKLHLATFSHWERSFWASVGLAFS